MNFIKIKETCLYVRDLEGARNFYHGLLGLAEIDYQAGKHLFLRVGSSVLLCFNPDDSRQKTSPPPHYGGGKQHLAFEASVADFEGMQAEVKGKGIKITEVVTWKSGAKSFYFEDPEGNVLEIVPEKGNLGLALGYTDIKGCNSFSGRSGLLRAHLFGRGVEDALKPVFVVFEEDAILMEMSVNQYLNEEFLV